MSKESELEKQIIWAAVQKHSDLFFFAKGEKLVLDTVTSYIIEHVKKEAARHGELVVLIYKSEISISVFVNGPYFTRLKRQIPLELSNSPWDMNSCSKGVKISLSDPDMIEKANNHLDRLIEAIYKSGAFLSQTDISMGII